MNKILRKYKKKWSKFVKCLLKIEKIIQNLRLKIWEKNW